MDSTRDAGGPGQHCQINKCAIRNLVPVRRYHQPVMVSCGLGSTLSDPTKACERVPKRLSQHRPSRLDKLSDNVSGRRTCNVGIPQNSVDIQELKKSAKHLCQDQSNNRRNSDEAAQSESQSLKITEDLLKLNKNFHAYEDNGDANEFDDDYDDDVEDGVVDEDAFLFELTANQAVSTKIIKETIQTVEEIYQDYSGSSASTESSDDIQKSVNKHMSDIMNKVSFTKHSALTSDKKINDPATHPSNSLHVMSNSFSNNEPHKSTTSVLSKKSSSKFSTEIPHELSKYSDDKREERPKHSNDSLGERPKHSNDSLEERPKHSNDNLDEGSKHSHKNQSKHSKKLSKYSSEVQSKSSKSASEEEVRHKMSEYMCSLQEMPVMFIVQYLKSKISSSSNSKGHRQENSQKKNKERQRKSMTKPSLNRLHSQPILPCCVQPPFTVSASHSCMQCYTCSPQLPIFSVPSISCADLHLHSTANMNRPCPNLQLHSTTTSRSCPDRIPCISSLASRFPVASPSAHTVLRHRETRPRSSCSSSEHNSPCASDRSNCNPNVMPPVSSHQHCPTIPSVRSNLSRHQSTIPTVAVNKPPNTISTTAPVPNDDNENTEELLKICRKYLQKGSCDKNAKPDLSSVSRPYSSYSPTFSDRLQNRDIPTILRPPTSSRFNSHPAAPTSTVTSFSTAAATSSLPLQHSKLIPTVGHRLSEVATPSSAILKTSSLILDDYYSTKSKYLGSGFSIPPGSLTTSIPFISRRPAKELSCIDRFKQITDSYHSGCSNSQQISNDDLLMKYLPFQKSSSPPGCCSKHHNQYQSVSAPKTLHKAHSVTNTIPTVSGSWTHEEISRGLSSGTITNYQTTDYPCFDSQNNRLPSPTSTDMIPDLRQRMVSKATDCDSTEKKGEGEEEDCGNRKRQQKKTVRKMVHIDPCSQITSIPARRSSPRRFCNKCGSKDKRRSSSRRDEGCSDSDGECCSNSSEEDCQKSFKRRPYVIQKPTYHNIVIENNTELQKPRTEQKKSCSESVGQPDIIQVQSLSREKVGKYYYQERRDYEGHSNKETLIRDATVHLDAEGSSVHRKNEDYLRLVGGGLLHQLPSLGEDRLYRLTSSPPVASHIRYSKEDHLDMSPVISPPNYRFSYEQYADYPHFDNNISPRHSHSGDQHSNHSRHYHHKADLYNNQNPSNNLLMKPQSKEKLRTTSSSSRQKYPQFQKFGHSQQSNLTGQNAYNPDKEEFPQQFEDSEDTSAHPRTPDQPNRQQPMLQESVSMDNVGGGNEPSPKSVKHSSRMLTLGEGSGKMTVDEREEVIVEDEAAARKYLQLKKDPEEHSDEVTSQSDVVSYSTDSNSLPPTRKTDTKMLRRRRTSRKTRHTESSYVKQTEIGRKQKQKEIPGGSLGVTTPRELELQLEIPIVLNNKDVADKFLGFQRTISVQTNTQPSICAPAPLPCFSSSSTSSSECGALCASVCCHRPGICVSQPAARCHCGYC